MQRHSFESELKPGQISEKTTQQFQAEQYMKMLIYQTLALESPESSRREGVVLWALSLEVWTLNYLTQWFQRHCSHSY